MLIRLLLPLFVFVAGTDEVDRSRHMTTEELCQKVEALLADKKLAEADSTADRVVRSNPRSAITHRNLARIYRSFGHRARAIKHLCKAISYDPSAEDYLAAGRLLSTEGRHALALEHLEEADTLGCTDPNLFAELGLAYAHVGRDIGQLRTIVLDAGRPGQITDDWYLIKRIPLKRDTFLAAPRRSAIYQLEFARSKEVDRLDVDCELARVWIRQGNYNRAASICRTTKKQLKDKELPDPLRAEFFIVYSKAVYGLDDMEQFVALVARAAKLDPKRAANWLPTAYRKAADRFKQRGDLTRCIFYLEKFLVEQPDSAEGHYDLGIAYLEAGKKQLAAQHLQTSLDLPSDHDRRTRILELLNALHTQ